MNESDNATYDEEVERQAKLAEEKLKASGLKKKSGMFASREKKQFDSADYFKEKEQGTSGTQKA